MSSKGVSSEQVIRVHHVIRRRMSDRGHALVAAQDISPPLQILFVRQPLIIALESQRLPDACYQCFQSTSDQTTSVLSSPGQIDLKACAGCKVVKFCDRTCQKLAWNRFHKHECKIFNKLHPRVLPTAARAIVRTLLLKKQNALPPGEWAQLLSLESHQDKFSKQQGSQWEDLCLMAKAVHAYSGTTETIETVVQICCILTVNSFTLTNPVSEPLGVILHPLPALINHSCTPNAYVRFDIPPPPESTLPNADRFQSCSISVHALEPIPKDTEITISYIDTSIPTPDRQSELSSQYFFSCSCSLCQQGPDALTDKLLAAPTTPSNVTVDEARAQSLSTLSNFSLQDDPPNQIHQIRTSLSLLAQTKRFPQHLHPLPQLRAHLIRLYISTKQYLLALWQTCLKSYPIDAMLYPSKHHPTRVLGTWMIYTLSRTCLIQLFEEHPELEDTWRERPRGSDVKTLVGLMCAMLKEVADTVGLDEARLLGDDGDQKESSDGSGNRTRNRNTSISKNKNTSTTTTTPNKTTTTNNTLPPPYIGPETPPPDALPGYTEANQTSGDYPDSTFGRFEQMVAEAWEQNVSGDGQMFWNEFESGNLPGDGDMKMEMFGKVVGLLDEEERYAGGGSELVRRV